MDIGSIVRYKEYPHDELHNSGMIGIILGKPYTLDPNGLLVIDVLWDRVRPQGRDTLVTWDYVSELENVKALVL